MTDYYIQRNKKEFISITPQQGSFFVTRTNSKTFGAGEIEPLMMKKVYKKIKKENFEKITNDEDFALYLLLGGYKVD